MTTALADSTGCRLLNEASFSPAPMVTSSGHVRGFEETYQKIQSILPRVPVTRVYNVTQVERGCFPVWSAVTPLAKDLTVHAGKGATELAAKLSAIMEGIERVSAESVARERVDIASFRTLTAKTGLPIINPETLNLPFETAYVQDQGISWVVGYDLVQRENVWVPLDAVISPAREGVCIGVETNGLAAGNTIVEAGLHAVYEVIERDAVSLDRFCDLHGEPTDERLVPIRVIDNKELLDGAGGSYIKRIRSSGLDIIVQELTSDIGVPVMAALIIDNSCTANGYERTTFVGHGCDLDSQRALLRAISEASQARSMVALGARETFEGSSRLPDRTARLRRQLDLVHARRTVTWRAENSSTGDAWEDLNVVVSRLASCGFERCVAVDLTRPDLAIPVVRLLIPGLEPPFGFSRRRPGRRLLRLIA